VTDRAGVAAGADDSDHRRAEQVTQALDVGPALPRGDRLQEVLVGCERDARLDHTIGEATLDRQPGVGQQLQHGVVAREGVGVELTDAPPASQRAQVLEKQRADAPVMHVIGDSHGDLGNSLVTEALVTGHADDRFVQEREQRAVTGIGRPADPFGDLIGDARIDGEEPQVETLRREGGMESLDGLPVLRTGLADLDRGPVGQQSE
jgi:hypothetical protein